MSGIRNSNADYYLDQLVREESNREKIQRIQPQTVEYEGRVSQADGRQPGSQQNISANHGSGVRVQSPTLSNQNRNSNENINVESGSARYIGENRVQSPGLHTNSSEWRGSRASGGLRKDGDQYGQIRESQQRSSSLGVHQGNLSGINTTVNRGPYGPVSGNQGQIIKERNQKFVSDHTVNKQSKIEYVPFQRKVTEYQIRERRETVPKKRMVTEYEEKVIQQLVPRVVTKNDYYAVQYVKDYVVEKIPEKTVRMVEKRVPYKRIQYVPVTREVIHYHGGGADHQGMQMNGGQMMQANCENYHFAAPSFYQNYNGNFFNSTTPYPQAQPVPQPIPQTQSFQTANFQTRDYSRGIEQLSRYSSNVCHGFKLKKNYNLYDHYETYIPSFKY